MKKIISAISCLALALTITVASVSASPAPSTVDFEGDTYTIGENNKMAFREVIFSNSDEGQSVKAIDVISNYKTSVTDEDNWISTSYGNYGFIISDYTEGLTVTPSAKSILNGNYMQVSFTAKADSNVENGFLGIYYDVEINSNDDAQLNVIKNGTKVIGFDMTDDYSPTQPKLSVYLRGNTGVTDVDTYWFGDFSDDTHNFKSMETDDPATLYGSEYESNYIKDTDGNLIGFKDGDSTMNFAWNNINLAAGESKTFSIIIGVGNANSVAPIISSVEKTDAGYVVKGTQTGDYEKQNFSLMYKIENENLVNSTSAISWNGDNFSSTIPVDVSKFITPGDYTIAFSAMNNYGAISNSVNTKFNVAAPTVIEDEPTPLVTIPEQATPKAENPKTNAGVMSISAIAGMITICGGVTIISRRKKESK